MEPRLPEPRMRDEFRRQLRARLIAEANATLPRATRRDTAWTFLRPAVAVGLAAIVLLAGAGSAAAGSLPGDPAFGLKKVIEDVQLALTFDEIRRVQLLAELADRRLGELEQVAGSSDRAPVASEEYAQAVERFRAAVNAVQEAAPADKSEAAQQVADASRDKHEAVLDEIEQKVPEQAKPAIQRARDEEKKDTTKSGKDKKGNNGDSGDGSSNGSERSSATPEQRRTETPEPTRSPRASQSPIHFETGRPVTPRPTDPRATADPDRTEDHD